MNTHRYSRQQDIIPALRLAPLTVTVLGVGAIGRQVALQLTAVGVPGLQLIDFDNVEETNLASQGYLQEDLGRLKVEATADLCHRLNPKLDLHTVADRFRRCMPVHSVIFCCVDTIETRRLIWSAVQDQVAFFCDGRMSAEVLRVVTACDGSSRERYPKTLFAQEQAYQGACTAKATIYCANIAAGLMLSQFSRYLRGFPIDVDVQLNLLATELTVRATE